ncbi:MAG: DUF1284 domain-containing protein [Lachnospiraceae bacterium]|nr:DUF1284 domain-containing protein [Lachnospiraceae bacterium]
MKLRPHHLLCIQKYTGHGYDETFTKHMDQLVESLMNNPEIELQEGCDDLCVACPNNQGGCCNAYDKVKELDDGVLWVLALDYKNRGSWEDFSNFSRKNILENQTFDRICHKCEWFDLCKSTPLK